MQIARHEFTEKIIEILNKYFPNQGDLILSSSELLKYLNIKTRAANRGSKARAGLANNYAIYVLIEDYLDNDFHINNQYQNYKGAQYSDLLSRQRELPFGSKLQNHALNHRLNEEFKKFFPISDFLPIIRDAKTKRYWINENLVKVTIGNSQLNIAEAVKDILDTYITTRMAAFNNFVDYCQQMIKTQQQDPSHAVEFIRGLLRPNIDARVFEIVSYAILKEYYADQQIYWGWSLDELNIESLVLYKTGRTNANDGGIDFVIRPLGRFFQVTETIDAGKYFLDIDKVQRYPITFVVKSEQTVTEILSKLKEQAKLKYNINFIVERYMESIEEVINIPELMQRFDVVLEKGKNTAVIEEIVLQSRIEFNVEVEEQNVSIYEDIVEEE